MRRRFVWRYPYSPVVALATDTENSTFHTTVSALKTTDFTYLQYLCSCTMSQDSHAINKIKLDFLSWTQSTFYCMHTPKPRAFKNYARFLYKVVLHGLTYHLWDFPFCVKQRHHCMRAGLSDLGPLASQRPCKLHSWLRKCHVVINRSTNCPLFGLRWKPGWLGLLHKKGYDWKRFRICSFFQNVTKFRDFDTFSDLSSLSNP